MTTRFSDYIANTTEKKTLYVHRPLLNGDALVQWAKSKGCTLCLKPENMHVTLCYSKTPLVWPSPKHNIERVTDYVSDVKKFDGGALVLHFDWLPFKTRNQQLLAAGATSDYPDYKSHITLTYESEGLDPESFGSYDGDLLFGPEVFKEVDLEKRWKNSNLEESADLLMRVRGELKPNLLKPKFAGGVGGTSGHCYVASEAMYHMMGGKEAGLTPHFVHHEGQPHWFLKRHDGTVIDPTADQFTTPVPYEKSIGKGFLTKQPSKRAQQIIDRVRQ